MKKIAVIFSNGTEELEALTPVDLLRRCDGAICDIVSICGEMPVGSHGIAVKADKTVDEFDMADYDAIVIPGGMPGATYISQNKKVVDGLKQAFADGKLVASICASPAVVLAQNNLIDGKKVTCYPADVFIDSFSNCNYTAKNLQIDGNLITADGPQSAFEFAKALATALGLSPKFEYDKDKIKKIIVNI